MHTYYTSYIRIYIISFKYEGTRTDTSDPLHGLFHRGGLLVYVPRVFVVFVGAYSSKKRLSGGAASAARCCFCFSRTLLFVVASVMTVLLLAIGPSWRVDN